MKRLHTTLFLVLFATLSVHAAESNAAPNGIPGHAIENLAFANLTLEITSGGNATKTLEFLERESAYPEFSIFDKTMPAYDEYVRHARIFDFKNVPPTTSQPDARPANVFVDGEAVTTDTLKDKPRVLVLTDISNEPDDEESLVRFLVYANEFDVEGLIATTSTWLKKNPRQDLIRRDVEAYALVRTNLLKQAPGFPTAKQLLAVTTTGQTNYGMACVGAGKSSAGSQLIIDAADKNDPRPLWISIWSGANTLAQALTDVRATRNADDLKKFVAKLRVYSISDQDDAGAWIRREFPDLFYIVSPSNQDGKEYWRATWTGISGDRWYRNGPMHKFEMVDNPWLESHVRENHGPLGALYPPLKYIMEGDTPSFIGLINNGLDWADSPSYGGWGGRYVFYKPSGETHKIWSNNDDSRDTVMAENGITQTSDPATIWRWREQFQNDFAARMNWCIAESFTNANHNPVAVLNGDRTKNALTIPATNGATISLSAEGTSDPDGNAIREMWWVYHEAGNSWGETLTAAEGLKTEVHLPQVKRATKFHVILQVEDDGSPPLTAYRRAIIEVQP